MSVEMATWGWLIAGATLMVLEVVLPGLVAVFLGLGAVLVAGARWLGWVDGWMSSFTVWFVASSFCLLVLRGLARRWLPNETERGQSDEDAAALGKIVEVVETIEADGVGRIRFTGTTWQARTLEGRLEAGQKARLAFRQGTLWVVEAVAPAPAPTPIEEN